jgi:hypothetical protein
MHDPQPARIEQISRMLQEPQTRRALPLRIGVRKMSSDVSKPSRAQQRVAQSMRQHVTVGMTHGTLIERNFDPADHQLAPFGQPV